MHFAKTYTQLLLSLPPELRENAIQYRQVSFFSLILLMRMLIISIPVEKTD